MTTKDIHLIFYLPNLSAYRDRAFLIGQIAKIIGKAVLVTSKIDIESGMRARFLLVVASKLAQDVFRRRPLRLLLREGEGRGQVK